MLLKYISLALICASIILFNATAQKQFSLLVSKSTNIKFNNVIKDTQEANIFKYANYYGGAGVGIGDFNNDGLNDIFFAGNLVYDKLYFNQGGMKFKDVTKKNGIIQDNGWSTGVTVADINNDGNLDIYVSRELYDDKPELRKNLLYINDGKGNFNELAQKYGVDNQQRTRHATFFDYNNDGLLDLLLLTQPPNPGSYSKYYGTDLLLPEYNIKLYKNEKGKFIDVTINANLNVTGFPNAVTTGDFNNDGWSDIYITNDFYVPDFIFFNNKNGTFRNTNTTSFNHTSYFSMGVDAADINNDGWLDIFVVDMVAEDNKRIKANMSGMNPKSFWKTVNDYGVYQYMYNSLNLNNGNETFSDIAQMAGMASTDWSWSNLIADYDNDGLKDVYITNGLLRDIRNTDADKNVSDEINKRIFEWIKENSNQANVKDVFEIIDVQDYTKLIPSQPIGNYMYRNNDNLTFKKTMKEWGLEQKSFSNGSAYADLDNDGDLDIVVNNINEPAYIYRNNANLFPNSNYLKVRLIDDNNMSLFGSKLTIYYNKKMQFLELANTRGMYSTSEQVFHFGLYNNKKVDSLVVIWPNREITKKSNIKANQELKVFSHEKKSSYNLTLKKNNKRFKKVNIVSEYKHQENNFDDYKYQSLLPHKMSQFGPALAVGDVNNDNLDDVFMGGAKGFTAKLLIQQNNNTFKPYNKLFWQKEKEYEDIDSIFLDIDNDKDLDLFVVSGGNYYEKNNKYYASRLYLNDGKGNFTNNILDERAYNSGSVVKVTDFDNDGDLDLFVGGRHVPHEYPTAASSKLWENVNNKLVNVTSEKCSLLENLGMVTDAIWVDYDLDQDQDLIVVGEWMPITIFNNDNSVFKKVKNPVFDSLVGWWFSIEKGDFDNDGDMDFIVGNLGLNYKYKTSISEPFDIYYNDFDNNGIMDIVLGYYNSNEHFPVRGFSCSSNQMHILKSKIKTYNNFASLSIYDIYDKNNLDSSLHLKTTEFASLYIQNNGNGNFTTKKLPRLAQISSVNDILSHDFDKDGNPDALLVGNLFVSEVETPRNDGGTGLLLLGNGDGTFRTEDSKQSGFFTNKDTKKIQLLNNDKMMILGNNNDVLESFRILK